MKRLLCITLILCAFGALPAWAGRIDVSGPVYGLWPAGSSVYVSDSAYIPVSKSLLIQSGVDIYFKTNACFTINGGFVAEGTERAPIVLHTSTGWKGFNLTSDTHERSLKWVVMSPESGTPETPVTARSSWLLISDCQLKGQSGCLSISGGRIRSDRNLYTTSSINSKTVFLSDLAEVSAPDTGSWLHNDIIVAEVPDLGQPQFESEFTSGLMVQYCLPDLRDNTISVRSPKKVYGAYFRHCGGRGVKLQFCVIAVRSLGEMGRPYGIVNDVDGAVSVFRCTVDVARAADAIPSVRAVGVWSTAYPTQIIVNSSVVVVDSGNQWFVATSRGYVEPNYITRWVTSGLTALDGSLDGGGAGEPAFDSDLDGVNYGDSVITADPHFAMRGNWGAWTSAQDVYNYYQLAQNSPCIDRADPTTGDDPDNTPPDMGRFYYRQFVSEATPQPVTVLPSGFALSAPFPNPFNATAIVPFVLSKNGDVRVIVYDLLGRQVATLASGPQSAGDHQVPFQANDLASGLYFVTMELNGARVAARPLLLMK